MELHVVRRETRRVAGMVPVRRGSQLRGNTPFLQYCSATNPPPSHSVVQLSRLRSITVIGNRLLRQESFHLVELPFESEDMVLLAAFLLRHRRCAGRVEDAG